MQQPIPKQPQPFVHCVTKTRVLGANALLCESDQPPAWCLSQITWPRCFTIFFASSSMQFGYWKNHKNIICAEIAEAVLLSSLVALSESPHFNLHCRILQSEWLAWCGSHKPISQKYLHIPKYRSPLKQKTKHHLPQSVSARRFQHNWKKTWRRKKIPMFHP